MIDNRAALARSNRHELLCDAIEAGIRAAHPEQVLGDAISLTDGMLSIREDSYDLAPYDRVLVLGGGNAAGVVAAVLEELLGDHIDGGVVVTDNPEPTDRIEIVAGSHPLPTEENVEGTRRLLDMAAAAGEDTLVLVAVTGGGSALLCAPRQPIDVEQYRSLTDSLLESGATIDEINAVRKHISRIKGGQLAQALVPATTVGLVFSDVSGNKLDVIASGPLSPDPTTVEEALDVCDRYDLSVPGAVKSVLDAGEETPIAGEIPAVPMHILADNRTALTAAATCLERAGYTPLICSDQIEGEAREAGRVHAGLAAEYAGAKAATKRSFSIFAGEDGPVALLSGGETTVTVSDRNQSETEAGGGQEDSDAEREGSPNRSDEETKGGPNQECALAAALALPPEGDDSPLVAAVDTDGIDGPTDAAGAMLSPSDIDSRSAAQRALSAHDVYAYIADVDGLVRTGPTGTNVNDLRVLLLGSP